VLDLLLDGAIQALGWLWRPVQVPNLPGEWPDWLVRRTRGRPCRWIFRADVPAYRSRGYKVVRSPWLRRQVRTTRLEPADLQTHGYALLMEAREPGS
jgi:hypothetical protein